METFEDFLDLFPELSLPFHQSESEAQELAGREEMRDIPEALAKKWICEVPGSQLICVAGPDMPESEGLYLLDKFVALGKLRGDFGWWLWIHMDHEGYGSTFVATYDEEGNLRSRILFAGSTSSIRSRYGSFQARNLILEDRIYEIGFKGKKGKEVAKEITEFQADGSGYLWNMREDVRIEDQWED